MYGKKRVVFQKDGQIILAGSDGGGGVWRPVGWLLPHVGLDGTRSARVLKEYFSPRPTVDDDFETINAATKSELRQVINSKYKWAISERGDE